jgi:hypothetical protein
MSNNNFVYYKLKNAYTYSCSKENNVYKTINNGNNCLCQSEERSTFDKTPIKSWPIMKTVHTQFK